MSSRRGTPRGRLRVSLPATIGRLFVEPRLPRLLERYPDIALEVSASDRWGQLVEESIDVALRIGTLTDCVRRAAQPAAPPCAPSSSS